VTRHTMADYVPWRTIQLLTEHNRISLPNVRLDCA
jgi:hypothetical protein